MSDAVYDWLKFAVEVEIHKAGNASGLIDWYNNGADGQIDWGSEGDFEQCVAIAGQYLDNPEGFCQLRHIDATGEPAGKAPGEVAKADEPDYGKVISDRKGEPDDQDLYNKVKAEAEKKFDVYPSAVANGWVVQEYKRRGGTYSVAKASDSYTPPQAVQAAAQRALEWIADGKAGDGFTDVGRKRASDLAHGHAVSFDTVKRMKAFFDRHAVDKKAPGFTKGDKDYPSAGRVAWDAWGGEAGYSWAKGIVANVVEKGDLLGHIFHGNQFTTGEASGRALKLATRIGKRSGLDFQNYSNPFIKEANDIAAIHQQRFLQLADASQRAAADGEDVKADLLKMSANDQYRAAAGAQAVAKSISKYLNVGKNFSMVTSAANSAAALSVAADKSWDGNQDIISTYSRELALSKGDVSGHVFRGNQHSVGGIVRFDPYNALFQTHCASGHQNTTKVPPQWIERNPDGSFTGQFAASAPTQYCSTCSRPIDNRWQLVNGQKPVSPPPTQTDTPYSGFVGQAPKNYIK